MLSLEVENIEEATAEMKSKGIRQVKLLRPGTAIFHPKDLQGVMIELTERK